MAARFPWGKQLEFPVHCIGTSKVILFYLNLAGHTTVGILPHQATDLLLSDFDVWVQSMKKQP